MHEKNVKLKKKGWWETNQNDGRISISGSQLYFMDALCHKQLVTICGDEEERRVV